MKILLIKQTSLGDLIHSTLAIEAVKAQYPDAEIHFMVDRACAFAVENNPHIDKFFYYDQQDHFRRLRKSKLSAFKIAGEILSELKKIRQHKYDIAIDLQGIERSVFYLYFCKTKKKFVKGKKPFLKGFKNASKDDHALTELKGTLKLAEINCDDFFPKIYLHEESGKSLDDKLPKNYLEALNDSGKKFCVISPYTSWKTKDVPVKNWLQAAELIAGKENAYFVFSATPDKREELQKELDQHLPESLKDKVLNFAGKTNIQELLSLIGRSSLVMASEGAAGHMASALDTPLCVVFGPTKPSRVGPWGDKAKVIQSPDASCLGCYKRSCDEWICMDFSPQLIADAAFELWAKN
ncbi:MAG: glycosyltransferase family 9 protein [Lentisphaeraceae bacterium]|nr:glycosyltransferase family 9 protein [Lentisphaeraceae bacterium]